MVHSMNYALTRRRFLQLAVAATATGIELPVALQLSGHSHGGQVRLPSTQPDVSRAHILPHIFPHMATRYPIGHYNLACQQLYTNRGLGVWPRPFRLNCRPEITLFTLHPA